MTYTSRPTSLVSLIFISMITISACTPTESQSEASTLSVGWLHGNCLGIKNPDLSVGTDVKVIDPDAPDSTNSAKIKGVASTADECHALLDDRQALNREQGNYFYVIAPVKPVNMAFGIVRVKDAAGQVDLNTDGENKTYYYCNTSEGVDFSIWQGKPYKSSKLWSAYYYLGYDMKPNCPQE